MIGDKAKMKDARQEYGHEDRACGILLPVFSLPSGDGEEYSGGNGRCGGHRSGGGRLGQPAYDFIDRLARAGQRFWQILPLGPANDKNCPYQSTSAFAGDPGYISQDMLDKMGLSRDPGGSGEFERFCEEESFWLDDYALYTALAERFGRDWPRWEDGLRAADPKAKEVWSERLGEEIEGHKWDQFLFFRQWGKLLSYAHDKGIEIIGDVPYSVAFESADCWIHRELFGVDGEGRLKMVAGAPPDYFTPEGQCWNNPLHDWQAHKAQGYGWWIDRIRQQFRFFDILRIDHMRGFESYYAIPSDTRDPRDGHWEKGPGMDFFRVVEEAFGRDRFIAEDLGFLTGEVHELIRDTGYPGMKVLQFAFDSDEENIYLPSNYDDDNCVVYTGTHDNDTTRGWYEKAEEWKKRFLAWYLDSGRGIGGEYSPKGLEAGEWDAKILAPDEAVRAMIELAHSSRAKWSIIPMQDYLVLGSEARINTPGIADGNWCWQMEEDAFTEDLADEIAGLCSRFGR